MFFQGDIVIIFEHIPLDYHKVSLAKFSPIPKHWHFASTTSARCLQHMHTVYNAEGVRSICAMSAACVQVLWHVHSVGGMCVVGTDYSQVNGMCNSGCLGTQVRQLYRPLVATNKPQGVARSYANSTRPCSTQTSLSLSLCNVA